MIQAIVYIPTIIGLVLIDIFVFLSNPKSRINQVFSTFSTLLALWLICLFIADTTKSTDAALFFVRTAIVFSSLYVPVFLYFAYIFPSYRSVSRIKVILLSIVPLLMASLAYSDLMIAAIKIQPWGAEVTTSGILYSVQGLYVLLYMVAAFVILIRKARRTRGKEKSQLVLVSSSVGFVLVANIVTQTILPVLGVTQYAVLIGVPAFLVLIAAIGYSILKHRLFNIRAIVARSLAYALSIAVFALIYAFLAFGLAQEVLLKNILTTELSREIFNVFLAVGLAFTFPTIRRFFERITDRIFYRDRYDPQLLVSDIGRVLASEILLEQLAKKVLALIGGQMRIEGSNIVVMSGEKIFYQTHAREGEAAYQAAELARFQRGVTITDELMNGEKRDILERHNVRAILPLRTKESFIGYLLLGEKKSGDIFSTQDMQTLEIIADELAVAILNARSYQEIQLFNETLREKVRVATAELRNANEELKDLDKAKDEFISMASHQLRTPLTAVRGYTSMVMDGDFGRITGEQKETLKQSFDAATRMTRLVDDLLNVSRMQSGKFKIERGDVDLNKVVPEEVSLLDTTAQMKHVAITFHPPKKHVPMLSIDEGKTRQCLMNLMDNAVYYSSTGKSPGKVDVYLEADGDWVSFRVVDNGIGVPKAQQKKLFQKFYRAPNAQKTRPDGTGLGLFLVGRVVKDQAGEIIFESEEGKGSTFGFRLPVKAAGEGV